jgi:hypothetical protein
MRRRAFAPGRSDGTRRIGPGRPGFTLLEITLAATIAVLLLSALYAAVRVQLGHAQAGRDVVEQSTLARQILRRIDNDVRAAVALSDPARFRIANSSSQSGSSSNSSSSSSSSGSSSGSGTTSSSGTGTSGSGASSTGGSSGSSSGSTNNSSSSSGSTTTTGTPFTIPFGVQGDSATLNLYVTKLPRDVLFGMADGSTPPVQGDIRRISYWLAGGGGLVRQEVKTETSPDMANIGSGSTPDEAAAPFAPEVQEVSFSYFDGTNWQESWDSTMVGDDGLTPIGPPRLIAITIAIPRSATNPGGRPGPARMKTYRHVVSIPTANGTQELANGALQQSNTNPQSAGTTTQTSGGGTSP